MPPARLLAIGGAHIDRRGIMTAPFVAGASVPGCMHEEVGGGAFNAAVNAVREGAEVTLVGLRGGDAAGDQVASALARYGIADAGTTYLDRATPSYTALVTGDGEVVAALADMALYDTGFEKELRRAKLRRAADESDVILIDANLPAAAATRAAKLAPDRPLYALAISPAKAPRLAGVIDVLALMVLNRREAHALTGVALDAPPQAVCAALRSKGLRGGVVTDGAGPVIAFNEDSAFTLQPPPVDTMQDATGAGDALAGTTIAHLPAGKDLETALRRGLAAAALTVTHASASAPLNPVDIDALAQRIAPARPIAQDTP